ncbi:MAG: extracellular solute-binding protein [Lachnospiraceae bacterium]|nr:extracellular solute-binding protein [Lachnospiraceae bacterium]
MKKNSIRTWLILGIISTLLTLNLSVLTACSPSGSQSPSGDSASGTEQSTYEEQLLTARTTPYGKYPSLITYTLGKLTGANRSNMPEDDTYEDNAYTRLIRELINVQNEDVFENEDEQYDANVSMAITSGKIPDIMVVSNLEDLKLLVEYDMVEDLTESFENCMSDTIKEIYASYGQQILDIISFDDKIMAIPETNIDDGPNLLWLRKDWMDQLGLEAPETLADAEEIIRQFIEKDPGGNGPGNTIGLVCDPMLCGECGYSSEYLLDIVFASYDAYPKQWIYNENGEIVYGSVQPECIDALAHIRDMYESKLLDHDFLLRTTSNIIDEVVSGQCGSFFGPWWAPNNPLMEALQADPDACWMLYLLQTEDDGTTSFYSKNPVYKYVVVRKGFEYPEIACKIVSILFDYARYEDNDNEELIEYYQNNVDPTARPLAINVDYNDALFRCFEEISAVLDGRKQADDLKILERSYYDICQAYLEHQDTATPEEWAAYTSRVTACSLFTEERLNRVSSLFFGETGSMKNEWWKLQELESKTYLQIVTGKLDLEDFDTFVEDWYEQGGRVITEEVRQELKD